MLHDAVFFIVLFTFPLVASAKTKYSLVVFNVPITSLVLVDVFVGSKGKVQLKLCVISDVNYTIFLTFVILRKYSCQAACAASM
jgi:hypothetical protein